MLNPMLEIAKAVRDNGDPLLFVDGVTAVGSVDMKISKMRPDALVFGSQKALALPPGLAIVCVSPRLLKKAETVENRGYYFDLVEIKKFADKDLPLTTPAVSLLYGLDYQLDKMAEGRFDRKVREARGHDRDGPRVGQEALRTLRGARLPFPVHHRDGDRTSSTSRPSTRSSGRRGSRYRLGTER